MTLFCYNSASQKHQKTIQQITLGRYLIERLFQLKIGTIFGVSRDFNLSLIDKIYEVESIHGKDSIKWAGNVNELNAAFAADGYSRCSKSHLGVLISSFGSGELTCLNSIAGSFAEHVGLIHIVGMPSDVSQSKDLILSHTLDKGDFTIYHKIFSNVSETNTILHDILEAPGEIDRCLKIAYLKQKPVYIGIPQNLIDVLIPITQLETPIDLSTPSNASDVQHEIVSSICKLSKTAKNPIIIVDAGVSRHDCKSQVSKLIETTQFPTFVTPMGKSAIDEGGVGGEIFNNEENPLIFQNVQTQLLEGKSVPSKFGGVYIGSLSRPEIKKFVQKADLVISVGTLSSNFNTALISFDYPTNNVIEIHSDHIKIKQALYQDIHMKELLTKLNSKIEPCVSSSIIPQLRLYNTPAPVETKLTQSWFWTRVSSWFRPGDIIISESGSTSSFGILETRFPSSVIAINQTLWSSIGYSIGACLGASMVIKEQEFHLRNLLLATKPLKDQIPQSKRATLFIGDGSLQFSINEISTIVKNGGTPYIFILNNSGYTTERLVHDLNAKYNDIQNWDYTSIGQLFNSKNYENFKIETQGDANKIFYDKSFGKPDKLKIIEVKLDKFDAPESLIK
ncbi:unnamed protein product [Candida verbasci]|uniref:Pyruvate decarboxylase n=1 Tax=Candida verbasci TaxID=1227364 RepID=A0A9W4XHR5_9ASCO|nr:unnamed protein product [Candida verbasci]